jgi:hypothetical protein
MQGRSCNAYKSKSHFKRLFSRQEVLDHCAMLRAGSLSMLWQAPCLFATWTSRVCLFDLWTGRLLNLSGQFRSWCPRALTFKSSCPLFPTFLGQRTPPVPRSIASGTQLCKRILLEQWVPRQPLQASKRLATASAPCASRMIAQKPL